MDRRRPLIRLLHYPLLTLLVSSLPAVAALAQQHQPTVREGAVSRAEQLDLARSYIASGRYYEASQLANRLLAVDPADSDAAKLRDEAMRGLKEYQDRKVAEADQRAKGSKLTDHDKLEIADTYFEGGRYISAAAFYGQLSESARSTEVRLRHARALAWSGKLDDAERIYVELLRDANDPALELEYGRTLSWMGATRPAIQRLRALHEKNPSEEVVVALANAHAWSGDREAALALLRDDLAAHPDHAGARELMMQIESGPDLRIERVDRMIEVEPYNLALRVERARLLRDAGRFSEALRAVEFVEEHATQKIEGLAELRDDIERRRAQEIAALREQLAAIDTSTDDPDQILNLAKAHVGVDDYDTAIRLYERYLSMRPDDTEARIQYARVLGWDQRYRAAKRQYRRLVDENPDRADLRLEYAQILSYDADYVPAMRTFQNLTNLSSNPRAHLYEEVPARAHYNLGQIYRWFGWNEHAVMAQNDAIAIDGSFTPARRELDLVRHLRPANTYDGTYTYSENSNNFVMQRVDLEASKWTSQRTAWDVLVGRHMFERTDLNEEVEATSVAFGGRYRWQDRWNARARVGVNNYSDDLGTRFYWGVGAEHQPSIQSRFVVDYAHYDLVYDVFTVESLRDDPLAIDDFRAHWDYTTGGHWAYLADLSYGFIDDDNERLGAHGLLSYRILRSPYVAVKADGRYLSYDFRSNRYWSPSDYRSLAGVLHVGDNFRERLFWDAELKYGRSFEGDRESDIRAIEARITVPINDALDVVGSYADGKSGRIESVLGDEEFVNYWQRRWYVGVRVKRLFHGADRRAGRETYYYDNRRLDESPIVPTVGERR